MRASSFMDHGLAHSSIIPSTISTSPKNSKCIAVFVLTDEKTTSFWHFLQAFRHRSGSFWHRDFFFGLRERGREAPQKLNFLSRAINSHCFMLFLVMIMWKMLLSCTCPKNRCCFCFHFIFTKSVSFLWKYFEVVLLAPQASVVPGGHLDGASLIW